ncbi:MAG: N-6 DNA methylase [Pseudomonadota bacterium]
MKLIDSLATREGFISDIERKKRLGQFFTGVALGRLLSALASAQNVSSIIDPMAGSGDLLVACLEIGASPKVLAAIEIDPEAHSVCSKRLSNSICVRGNAFDKKILSELPLKEWDLVIANPPYVRYQSTGKMVGKNFKLPSAVQIRNGLIDALDDMTALNDIDRKLFKTLASGYSGVADMAVPSLILCASMVAIGGRLAFVIPEAWLTRDYASVIHYLLLRWFVIEYVVEDNNASWFLDAQVKTSLIIARRVVRKNDVFDWQGEYFSKLILSGKASGIDGPVSLLYPNDKNPEFIFSNNAKQSLISGSASHNEFLVSYPVLFKNFSQNLKAICSKQKWFGMVQSEINAPAFSSSAGYVIPTRLASWLEGNIANFVSLESLNISIGQGLRTGANDFFYSAYISGDDNESLIIPSQEYRVDVLSVPSDCLVPVIRRQSELSDGYMILGAQLSGRVFDFRKYALPEDIKAGGAAAKKLYSPMPQELAKFVRKVASINLDSNGKRIYELSAVAPNIRKGIPVRQVPPRFWYMLPDFAKRHLPDIVFPRINGGAPKAWLIDQPSKIAVDANFSTVSVISAGVIPDCYALFAFLNSSWCNAVLEYSASVMGGGALKVEAAHIRRIPVPKVSASKWVQLSRLGHGLAYERKGINEIDKLVLSCIFSEKVKNEKIAKLLELVDEGRARRLK